MNIKSIKRGNWYRTTQGEGYAQTVGGTRPPSVAVVIRRPIPRGLVNLNPRDILEEIPNPEVPKGKVSTSSPEEFPEKFQLEGGILWLRKTRHTGDYYFESEDDNYTIMQGDGFVVMVSQKHEVVPGDDGEFWRKKFRTVKEAMEYAEGM